MIKDKYYKPFSIPSILFLISGIVFIITAYNSNGYFYPDEHFQIIEFARWKMGICTPEAIPWELPANIRPTLQPIITLIIFKALEFCGLTNPFILALLLRIIMMLTIMYSVYYFINQTLSEILPKQKNAYIALSYLLWFIPYISVRYSSETMSAAFLLLAVGMICRMTDTKLHIPVLKSITIGILFGFSFEFRYQIIFAVIGLLCWYLFIFRKDFIKLPYFVLGFLLVVILSTLADSWFYGKPVFAPLNYFKENIINGVAASFGVSPWYEYILMIFHKPTPFIGTCLLISLLCSGVKHFKSPIVWCVFFFILGHSVVAHKELRFIFPIAYFFPIMLIWTWEFLYTPKLKPLFTGLIIIFALINVGGIILLSSKPTLNGRINASKYIYDNPQIKRIICSYENNIYRVSYLDLEFYRRKRLIINEDIDIYLLNNRIYSKDDAIIIKTKDIWRKQLTEDSGFSLVYTSVPKWLNILNRFYKTYREDDTILIYRKL